MSNEVLQSLVPLFEQKSSLSSIKEFHEKINITFHNVEAKYYDRIHVEMWLNLPEQVNRIIDHLQLLLKEKKIQKLKVLDLGCGTGLASQLLIDSAIGEKIDQLFLLDPSPAMLQRAQTRSQKWGIPIHTHCGYIEEIIEEKFDLIITSSVLHHIPDLPVFLHNVESSLTSNGIFISLHDPFAEAISSEIYHNRTHKYMQSVKHNFKNRSLAQRVIGKIGRILKPAVKTDTYIAEVNDELLKLNVIHTMLSPTEIWSVTDIHVEGLPYSSNNGVSLDLIKSAIKELHLSYFNTYCYFGTLKSNLPKEFQEEENNLMLNDDKFGRNFNSIWIKQ